MFKVKGLYNKKTYTVYAVKEESENIFFLVHDGSFRWIWINSYNLEPIK